MLVKEYTHGAVERGAGTLGAHCASATHRYGCIFPKSGLDKIQRWIQSKNMTGYEVDFVKWAEETARAITEGRWGEIDRTALADEVESLGKRDRKEIRSRLAMLLQHMLKTKYQPEKASRSWAKTILTQRIHIEQTLQDSPSLRSQVETLIGDAYRLALIRAAYEAGLPESAFPATCEWTASEVLGL